MSIFLISLFAVAVLLAAAVPGYILMKRKMLGEECIPGFSKLLVYVVQPTLVVYTFASTTFSWEKLMSIGIFAVLCLAINAVMLGGAYLIFRRRSEDPIYRIMTVASTFANCAFFGIPIIEALFPEQASELLIYTTVYAQVMNLIGWTAGSAIISRDGKYISLKKIFLNPASVSMLVAIAVFFIDSPFIFTIPGTAIEFTVLDSTITVLGRMATPLSMIIMGMRLATMDLKRMLTERRVYIALFIKQVIMPLVAFLIIFLLPIDTTVKQVFYIITACPVASVVLNYSELVGSGQREAASMVLLGTIMSIVTLPLMSLLLVLL